MQRQVRGYRRNAEPRKKLKKSCLEKRGISRSSSAYGLKKANEIWGMDSEDE